MRIVVINAAASNTLKIWPQLSTDVINALSPGAGYTIAANKTAEFFCVVAGQWNTLLTA
jgi:hypothetical protein